MPTLVAARPSVTPVLNNIQGRIVKYTQHTCSTYTLYVKSLDSLEPQTFELNLDNPVPQNCASRLRHLIQSNNTLQFSHENHQIDPLTLQKATLH